MGIRLSHPALTLAIPSLRATRSFSNRSPSDKVLTHVSERLLLWVLLDVAIGSSTNGHTMVACLKGKLQACGVGSNRIAPIAHFSVLGAHRLKELPRDIPSGLGIDPGNLLPTLLPQSQ